MRLETQRLYLRPLCLEDADKNYPDWFNDKEVCKYNSHGTTLYTKELAKEYISSLQHNTTKEVFAICLKETGKHIGNISLQEISLKKSDAEFAILMGEKEYWGKGLAKEAALVLFEYGFRTLHLDSIYCGTSEYNIPMQHLATSLGMQHLTTEKKGLLKNGVYSDVFHYILME